MAVTSCGARSQVTELFALTVDLEDQVSDLMTSLERVQETLSQLTALYPESLSYGHDAAATESNGGWWHECLFYPHTEA
jgi:hypothetical protein